MSSKFGVTLSLARRFAGLLTIATLSLAVSCAAPSQDQQNNFWDSPNAYLAQPRPSETPVIFAPGMLAESGFFVQGRVAFSRDGQEFYYTQSNSWESLEDAKIKVVRYEDNRWGSPDVVNAQFVSPTLSMDGETLYFRQGNMTNVWQSRRTRDGWSAPAPLIEGDVGVYDFMPTLSGNIYVGSDPSPEDVRNGSTYVFSMLTMSNGAVNVTSLGRPLNAPGWNGDFFIAPDESYMIVSANETPDFESELYISFRNADLTWTTPVSLGPEINNGLAHRWGQYVTPDNKYLFYSYGTSEADCAVYWVRFDTLLERLKPKRAA